MVDDEAWVLAATSRSLHSDDHEILTASSGEEAIALLQQHDIHLILSN